MRAAAAGLVAAALVAAVPAAEGGQGVAPRVYVASHGVRAWAYAKTCPYEGVCTMEGRGIGRVFPAHAGSRVLIRTTAPARKVVAGTRRQYAPVRRVDRAGRVWSFRIPRSERFPARPGDQRVREVYLYLYYEEALGSLFLFFGPHAHEPPFRPPQIVVDSRAINVSQAPSYCTWFGECLERRTRIRTPVPVHSRERVYLRLNARADWMRIHLRDNGQTVLTDFAVPRRERTLAHTWSFVVPRRARPRTRIELEIAYRQGMGTLVFDLAVR